MKSLRLLAVVLLALAWSATAALACDQHKAASKTAVANPATIRVAGNMPSVPADGGCSAEAITFKTAVKTAPGAAGCAAAMAAQCTPAMRAACEQNAAVAAAMGCNMKGAKSTKSAKGTAGTTAVTAGMTGASKSGCAAHGVSATAAATGAKGDAKAAAGCAMHGATAASPDACAGAKSAAVTASAAGLKCSAHMKAVAHECSACDDWTTCEQDVRALGAKAQVVSLKNGAMIVYTADSPAAAKALQAVVAKRNDTMMAALAAGSDQKLCDECKQLRGAIASGKLHRQVVNVERGCMTLITSNDRGVVQKIRAMTGQPVAMR